MPTYVIITNYKFSLTVVHDPHDDHFQQMEKKPWFKSRPALHAPFQVPCLSLLLAFSFFSFPFFALSWLFRSFPGSSSFFLLSLFFPGMGKKRRTRKTLLGSGRIGMPSKKLFLSPGYGRWLLPPLHGPICLRPLPTKCQ